MAAKYEQIRKCEANPKAKAGIFSRLTFWWMNDLLATGHERPLDNDDLYQLLEENKTERQVERLEKNWEEEVQRHSGKPYLFRALVYMFGWADYSFLFCLSFINGTCLLLQPVFLSLLLRLMTQGSVQDFWWGYIYGVGICVSSLVSGLTAVHTFHNSYVISMKWKVATLGLILKRVSTPKSCVITMSRKGCFVGMLTISRWKEISRARKNVPSERKSNPGASSITGSPSFELHNSYYFTIIRKIH